MSEADPTSGRDRQGDRGERPAASGKRGRNLILTVIVVGVAFLVAFMLLVSRCGAENEDEVLNDGPGSAGVSVVVEEPLETA